jgi:hypothetical protein
MTPKKYWTSKDGVVGTMHDSRDGKPVDFRPAELITLIKQDGETFCKVNAPKGQRTVVEPLILPIERREDVGLQRRENGQEMREDRYYALFLGVEVYASWGYRWEWWDEAAKARSDDREKKSEQDYRLRQKETQELEALVTDLLDKVTFEDLYPLVTSGEIGQLRAGSRHPEVVLGRALQRYLEQSGLSEHKYLLWQKAKHSDSAEFVEGLFSFDDRRREERKRCWLAGQGH